MSLSVIVAIARNGVIGLDNTLPWHLSEDLKRFKSLTMGHHIIMGRKTYESLGRLLPGRTTVIVTRNPEYQVPGAVVAHSLEAAIQLCAGDNEPFMIGGAQLYADALALADKLYITWIEREYQGDAYFPQFDQTQWQEVGRQPGVGADGLPYAFVDYVRKPKAEH